MITIAETKPFQKKASKLLASEEREELIASLAECSAKTKKPTFLRKKKTCLLKQSLNSPVIGKNAMSNAFTEIMAGLDDAINHAKGEPSKVIEHKPKPLDVKGIRQKTGMSQQKFCATFGISLGTLRHWEQGLRNPRGPARVLLQVMDKNPAAVIQAIAA